MKLYSSILVGIITIFLNSYFSYAADLEYRAEMERCTQAVANGTERSIDPEIEFTCPSFVDYGSRVYNIILDRHFAPIDDEADELLEALIDQKTYYFGKDRKQNSPYGIAMVQDYFGDNGYFNQQYKKECLTSNTDGIYLTAIQYIPQIPITYGVTNCLPLVKAKTSARKSVAFEIFGINNNEVITEEFNQFVRVNNNFYNEVSNLFQIHEGYTTRLTNKWVSKTKDAY